MQVIHSDQTAFSNTDLWRREQQRRIQKLHDACINTSLFENQAYRGGKNLRYYYSSKYNLSYCKVPKVGCTFWTQAFAVLNKGAEVANNVFGIARKTVHRQLASGRVNFDSDLRMKSRSVLISRDPYTRLYSAFVDKILFPADRIEPLEGLEGLGNVMCESEITFKMFFTKDFGSCLRWKNFRQALGADCVPM